jgi:hypothetical protein
MAWMAAAAFIGRMLVNVQEIDRLKLTAGQLTQINFFDSSRSRATYAMRAVPKTANFRDLDNQAFGALFTYSLGGHALGFGYQRMSGDDPFPYIGRSDPYLVNFVQIGDFANIDEHSWQASYRLIVSYTQELW